LAVSVLSMGRMKIQIGDGPLEPASLKRIPGTSSWAIHMRGVALFPERAPTLRLRAQDAAEWEAAVLGRFAGIRVTMSEREPLAC
jgi:hypothetical protein